MKKLTESPSLEPFEQAVIFYLQGINQEQAVQGLASLAPEDLTLPRCFALLRALRHAETQDAEAAARVRMPIVETIRGFVQSHWDVLLSKDPAQSSTPELQALSPEQTVMGRSFLHLWSGYLEKYASNIEGGASMAQAIPNGEIEESLAAQFETWAKFGFYDRQAGYQERLFSTLVDMSDFSGSEPLKIMAAAIADLMVMDWSLEIIGPAKGGVGRNASNAHFSILNGYYPYVLFGANELGTESGPAEADCIGLCFTAYRPPQALERLGAQQDLRGIFELKHRTQWNEPIYNRAVPVYKYSYVTPQFVLSSFQLRSQPLASQTRPWELLLRDEEEPGATLFTFAGNQLFSGNDTRSDETYDLWNATTFQHKNILYCRFHKNSRMMIDFETGAEFLLRGVQQLPTRVWLPNALGKMERQGDWWFVKHGEAFIAFRPVQGDSYWWRIAEEDRDSSGAASILSFQDLYSGFLLEVELASRFSSFLQFKQQILQAPLIADRQSVTFVSRRGDVYLFPKGEGDFLVNGRVIDPYTDGNYDLYSSPYTRGEYGNGYFTAKWSPFSLVLDLRDIRNPRRIVDAELNQTASVPLEIDPDGYNQ